MLYSTRTYIFLTGLLLLLSFNSYGQTASFSMDHPTGCAPLLVHFTNLSSGASSYSWNFGGAGTSTHTSPSWTFASPGVYAITLTATSSGGGTSTYTDSVRVYDTPTVYFRADTAVCTSDSVHFYDSSVLRTSGSGTYTWQLAPGVTSTDKNPVTTYSSSGNYTITLTAKNSEGCQSTLSKPNYVHVYNPPSVSFTASPIALCTSTGTVDFTGNVSGGGPSPYTYEWDYGDGSTHGTGATPTHRYSGYGLYTVKLTATSSAGCTNTDTKTDYISLIHNVPSFTVTPSPVCANEYITVTNTSAPSPTGTVWYFGDGSASTTTPDVHRYDTAGTYTIKLISTSGICTDSTTDSITVEPIPGVSFSALPLEPCPSPVNIYFTNHSSGASTYTWDFGDGSGSTTASPTHTYYNDGKFDIKLIAKNSYGCVDSADTSGFIKIYPLNLFIYGNEATESTGGCIPFTVNFYYRAFYYGPLGASHPTGMIKYPYDVSSVYWDFGDGTSSTADSPSHTYTAYGTYKVILNITTANGCGKADTFTVHAGTKPTASFTASPTHTCVRSKVTFTSTTDTATDYRWDFGDGRSGGGKTTFHRYTDTGSFTVTLLAINNGCPDTAIREKYINIDVPLAGYLTQYHCTPAKEITFKNRSLGGTSFTWDFGDGSSPLSTYDTSIDHLYPKATDYNASLYVYDSTTGCHDTITNAVSVYNPILSFTASDTVICKDVPITVTATLDSGVAIRYDWGFDGSIHYDTTQAMSYTFTTTGYHTVVSMVTDTRGCHDTLTKTNYIAVAKPEISFAAVPPEGCAPATISFVDSSTDIAGVSIATRVWDFGDGVYHTASSKTTTHYYPTAGTYYISFRATDNVGCSDSATKYAYVHISKPYASFTTSASSACLGQPIDFYNSSLGGGLTAKWDFGDGTTANTFFATHAYSATGTYTVKLTVTDSIGCTDVMVKTAYINIIAKPVAAFSMDDTMRICPPLPVHFTAHAVGAVRYYWDFGDPTAPSASGATTSWTYVNPGIYTVMLVVTNMTGCTDTAYGHVRLLGYGGILSYNPLSGCAPLEVKFKANISGVPDFIYDFGDGETHKTRSDTTTHIYTMAGPIVPKIIMTDDSGCSSESIGLDTIHVDGIYPGFKYKPFPACDSGTFIFYDTSHGAYSRVTHTKWIFDDGSTADTFITSHSYHAPGTYDITLIGETSTGCIDTFRSKISVYRSPIIDAGPDTTICLTDAATLIPSGGVSYVWTPAATLSCSSCASPQASPKVTTVYTVVGTDAHGCKNTDSTEVIIKTKTTSIAHGSGEICDGETIQLTDSAGYYSTYTWIPPYKLDDEHSDHPLANPDTSVLYTVIAQQGHCIPDTQYVNVIVHPLPTVDAGPDQTIIAGDTYQINTVGTYISKYAWAPNESLSCDSCSNPIATPKHTTLYTVTVYSDYGCKDSDKVTIHVICKSSQVFMPNTFTPNGDGQNDIFYPRGKGLKIIKSFRIYNRWGQLVFEEQNINTNEKQYGWDGTFNGAPLNPDVFVYIVDAICDTGEPISWKGNVSLIR